MKSTARLRIMLIVAACATAAGTKEVSAAFSTGFENPPYSSGVINGQDTWTAGTGARVLTETELQTELTLAGLNPAGAVKSGSQALLASSTGGTEAAIRPIGGLTGANSVGVSFWARPLTPGASGSTIGANQGNIFLAMESSAGTRAAAIRFGTQFGQTIDVFNEGTGWMSTGVSWAADSWYNLRLLADYTAKTYDVFINGVQVEDDTPFYASGSASFSQVRVFRGSGQAGMIVDDLSAVPEPSGLAMAALGGSLLVWRRRRS